MSTLHTSMSIHPFVSTNDLEQHREEAVTAALGSLRAVPLYLKLRLRRNPRLQLHPHIISPTLSLLP